MKGRINIISGCIGIVGGRINNVLQRINIVLRCIGIARDLDPNFLKKSGIWAATFA
ncbi:hypothetical protein [Nostoc sp.]|uniref:hypothetical protein n=1 Tax=Nostoc sp. TaxID=1180 RepID=UPI002FFC16D3